MSEQKPEAVWIFPEEPKKGGGRTVLLILLVVLALIVAGVVALFLIPHDEAASSPSPRPSTSSPMATPPSTAPATPVPSAPSATNTPTPPVPPELAAFRDEVSPRLETMRSELAAVRDSADPADAGSVENIRGSLQRISDLGAPDQIRAKWSTLLIQLDDELQRTQSNLSAGTVATSGVDAATATIGQLEQLLGG